MSAALTHAGLPASSPSPPSPPPSPPPPSPSPQTKSANLLLLLLLLILLVPLAAGLWLVAQRRSAEGKGGATVPSM